MPTIHIKVKIGDAEVEIKADGELDKETINAIKGILAPLTGNLVNKKQEERPKSSQNINIYSRFKQFILENFDPNEWFTSIDIKDLFEEHFGIKLKSSTTSTYLRRMENEGLLISRREGRFVYYKLYTPEYAVVIDNRFKKRGKTLF